MSSKSDYKFEELTEAKAALEQDNYLLQQDIQILTDTIQSHECQIKKLEYELGEVTKENNELKDYNTDLLSWCQENEELILEECQDLEDKGEHIFKLTKMSQGYAMELNFKKKEIKRLEQTIDNLKQ